MNPNTRLTLFASLLAAASAAPVAAQFPQRFPLERSLDLLVVDSDYDGVWRKSDFNQDRDYDDPGEIAPYYNDSIGSIALTNPTCIATGPLGVAYLADSTVDIVLALRDLDGDGDALNPGEHTVFFTSVSNASGIVMASASGITVDAIGNVFVAAANVSGGGQDCIIKLTDLNLDGDADDVGESSLYCVIPNSSGALGDSIPTKVVVGPTGDLFYSDVGTGTAVARGVYRLHDGNGNGNCNDPGEVTPYWMPPALGNAFYWGLAVDRTGVFYLTDHGNEQIWRGQDLNFDNRIDATEETLFYSTAGSTWWDVVIREDGVVIVCEDQTPDRLVALQDLTGDGDALDPNESWEMYNETVSSTDTKPRGASLMPAPVLVVAPATVRLGAATTIRTRAARPFDLVGLIASDRLAVQPLRFPPFGQIELNQGLLVPVIAGSANAQGLFDLPLTIPNDPALVASYAFQSLAGDQVRLNLTNGATLTITP
ncbi:MAG: hypothetical protein IPM29_01340 [Planctomycetes bacterium]|nr:hypothetical protein [Planctomycetota bacterium]